MPPPAPKISARDYLEQGDYANALEQARAVLVTDSSDFENTLVMADLALESSNQALFRKMIEAAARLAPADPRIAVLVAAAAKPYRSKLRSRMAGYAASLLARGRAADALAKCQRLLKLDPHWADAHGIAGDAQLALGKLAEGLESRRAATRFDPGSAGHWYELAMVLRSQRDLAGAASALQRALDREPSSERIATALAEVGRELSSATEIPPRFNGPRDLLICGPEMNRRHGTGILLKRLFPDSAAFVSLRSQSVYDGVEEFAGANLVLADQNLTPAEREEDMRRLLVPYKIRRILCVPYHPIDFQHGWLAQKITGAPLCTYVMDDQNVYANKVADETARQLFAASRLRLAISPEMSDAYQEKFDLSFSPLPPVLDSAEGRIANAWDSTKMPAKRCALIGTMWSIEQWRHLRRIARETGLKIDWFGYDSSVQSKAAQRKLADDGITCCGMVPEGELIRRLATYPFLLVPSGMLNGTEDNEWLTRLSLPSRIIYVLVKTLTPMLVFGHPDTAAGRFVLRCGLGLCTSDAPREARDKIVAMADPLMREGFIRRAREIADGFVMPDAGEWIWRSLDAGRAQPAPFDEIFDTPVGAPAAAVSVA